MSSETPSRNAVDRIVDFADNFPAHISQFPARDQALMFGFGTSLLTGSAPFGIVTAVAVVIPKIVDGFAQTLADIDEFPRKRWMDSKHRPLDKGRIGALAVGTVALMIAAGVWMTKHADAAKTSAPVSKQSTSQHVTSRGTYDFV